MFRTMSKLLAAGVLGGGLLAAVGLAGPAYADEGDAPACYGSTGSVSVFAGSAKVTSVPFGTNLTVRWTLNPGCQDYSLYMEGPGFGGELQGLSGSRGDVWATPPSGSHTLTWKLEMLPWDASSPQVFPVAFGTTSITVT